MKYVSEETWNKDDLYYNLRFGLTDEIIANSIEEFASLAAEWVMIKKDVSLLKIDTT